ncbi:MAG: ABC transporter permease [Blastocatellia bacterium]|nr:ABC transporter permease [Blastocatellia bacterium]
MKQTLLQRGWSFLCNSKRMGLAILGLLYLLSLSGGFIAPYNHRSQAKDTPFLPPTRIRFIDAQGSFHARPFIYRPRITDRLMFAYDEDQSQAYPLRFFVRGESYHWFGLIESNWHLMGVGESPLVAVRSAVPNANAPRLHVLGTDNLGRDVLARLLYAGQISLVIGPVGLLLAYLLGVSLGAISGYFGGWLDSGLMRAAEIVMSLPTLILILAFRAAFPLSVTPRQVATMMITIFAAVGWAEVARLTRNLALAERVKDYVTSAISLGASNIRIIARHVLPNITTPLLTQFALTAPTFILAEITLSFLGVGVQEPSASWGTMLADAKDLSVLKNYWWMLVPVACVFVTALAFQLLGEKAKDS